MESFSNSMLMWVFGKWIFDEGEVPQQYISSVSDVTPLVIFASLFSTTGLLMIGILGAWAAFLGIFRLRNNGNFFGAQNSNEAFFYPLRLVAAMMLCAPVIIVGSAGGHNVTLTPGHAMIIGITKTGSQMADAMQGESFRLMNTFNMYNEPNFIINFVDREQAKALIINWYSSAVQISADHRKKNPYDTYKDMAPDVFAGNLIEAKWRNTHESEALALAGETDPYFQRLIDVYGVPLIAPNDELAQKSIKVSDDIIDGTAATDMQTEGLFCKWGSIMCSDEYKATRSQNDRAIRIGIAKAQREVWAKLIEMSLSRVDAALGDGSTEDPGLSPAEMAAFNRIENRDIGEWATWYANTITSVVRDTIAAEHVASSQAFYSEMESWGWMAGPSFVLRAAADFSRMQSYAEGATSSLMPKSELSDLTSGDTMTKIAYDSAIQNIGKIRSDSNESIFKTLFSLDFLESPETLNISSIASWGRALAGTGLGIIGGSYLSGIAAEVFKPLAILDTTVIKSIGVILIVIGALLGYVLPIIFVISGIFGVITWFTHVIPSFYGVTLWSAAQAAPKGEEHSSQMAAKGWNILIFIGLYPVLSVGGLAAAVVITNAFLPFIGIVIDGMFGMFEPGAAAVGKPLEAIAGVLIGGLMLVIVFAVLSWSVCVTSAQLITNFPRTVLNMISFSEPGLNPYEQVGQGISANIGSNIQRVGTSIAAGHASKAISRLTGGSLRSGIDKASGQ